MKNPSPLMPRKIWKRKLNSNSYGGYKERNERINNEGFPIITIEVLDELTRVIGKRSVFEVGGGTGYLARLLRDKGVTIRSIDSQHGECTQKIWWRRPLYFNVEKLNAEHLMEFPGDIVLMSWPCYTSNFAEIVAQKMKKDQILIYQGEGQGGCTATDEFFNILSSSFEEIKCKSLNKAGISENSIHDFWSLFRKVC